MILGTCSYCGTRDVEVHLDHVVPRSRGGPDDPRNLVTACVVCNLAKSDRLPSEWLETVPFPIAEIENRICSRVAAGIRGSRGPALSPLLICDVCGKDISRAGDAAWVSWFVEWTPARIPAVRALSITCHGGDSQWACQNITAAKWRAFDRRDHHLPTFCGANAQMRFVDMLLDYTWPQHLLLKLTGFFFVASRLPGSP